MCVCVLLFFKANLIWIKRNTSVTFVIKFSAMDITETDMKRLVYFISIRGNVLREMEHSAWGPTGEPVPGRQQALTLQGNCVGGSGPLTPWGTGVHLSPGDLDL